MPNLTTESKMNWIKYTDPSGLWFMRGDMAMEISWFSKNKTLWKELSKIFRNFHLEQGLRIIINTVVPHQSWAELSTYRTMTHLRHRQERSIRAFAIRQWDATHNLLRILVRVSNRQHLAQEIQKGWIRWLKVIGKNYSMRRNWY